MNKAMFTSNSCEWATPQDLFDKLNANYNFTLDPCATKENAKCKKYYTKADDGLSKSWKGERVFCNPPYGKEIKKWVKKCYEEAELGGGRDSCNANSCKNRHRIFPRLYLRKRKNNVLAWKTPF